MNTYALTLCDTQGNAVCRGYDCNVEAETADEAIELAEYAYECAEDSDPAADGYHFTAERTSTNT